MSFCDYQRAGKITEMMSIRDDAGGGSFWVCHLPIFFKELAPFHDVLIEFVIRLAAEDKIVARAVLPHKGVEGGRFEPSDPFYDGLCKAVVYIFLFFLPLQPVPECLHAAGLFSVEQHVHVQTDAEAPSASRAGVTKVLGSIVEDLLIFLPVLQRVKPVVAGLYECGGQ